VTCCAALAAPTRAAHPARRYEKYGKVYKSSLLFGAVATVYDPADIRSLLNGEGTLTLPDFIPGFKDLLGRRSLLFATGKKHAQQRRILSQVGAAARCSAAQGTNRRCCKGLQVLVNSLMSALSEGRPGAAGSGAARFWPPCCCGVSA
jgi:cytochrome P450